jgi:hypothetical protein
VGNLLSWIRIRSPNTDPDPLTWLNPGAIRIWIRITTLEHQVFFDPCPKD